MSSYDKQKKINKKFKNQILKKNSIPFPKSTKLLETPNKSNLNNYRRFSPFFSNNNKEYNTNNLITINYSLSSKKNSLIDSNISSINNSKTSISYVTPRKYLSSSIKVESRKNSFVLKRFMTISSYRESKINYMKYYFNAGKLLKKDNKKDNKKESKKESVNINNLLKKFKLQMKIPHKNFDFSIKKKESNNKINIEKIKKLHDKLLKFNLKSHKLDITKNYGRKHQSLQCICFLSFKRRCELCKKLVDNFLYKLHYFSHPSQILNWIFLGNARNANNIEEIINFRIAYVLNCALEVYDKNLPKHIKYCHIKLEDTPQTNIIPFLEKALDFIELARKNKKKILIHCKLGISRSPSILIAYLVKYMNFTTMKAFDFIKSKRKQIQPNPGFLLQLSTYEKKFSRNMALPKYTCNNHSISKSTADFSSSHNKYI
jgi:protein-tyrosine phosphatase